MNGALDGLLVLDLSRLLPGPYCSMILADHGARVIVIEDRRFENEVNPILNSVNRNKEHLALNLKKEKGKEIFFSLAEKADVILEGFRPGVVDRLGVGYKDISAINPKVVYCSITGYGQSGPLRDRVGHDVNYLGQSGVLSLIGPKEGTPCIPGVQFADMIGGLNAAVGIMLALLARDKSGEGQYIDISMTDGMMAMLPLAAGLLWSTGFKPARGESLLSHRYACYNVYRTADNKYITLGALEPRFWEKVCHHFNLPEYIPLQFDEQKRTDIIRIFEDIFMKKTREQWMEAFKEEDACLGEVLELDEALESDYAKEREMVLEINENDDNHSVHVMGIPIKLSKTPGTVRSPSPGFGENTQSILKELGFSVNQVRELEREGVI